MTASTTPLSVHVAGFYQTDGFLVERVASFITEGLTAGERVIVLATTPHWTAISARLNASGLEFRRAVTEGRLLLLDANEVLDGLTVEGRVSVEGFRSALARFIAPGVRQRIYGELVSLLAERGDLDTGIAIESVGHELAHTLRMPVLCAYPAGGDHPLTPEAINCGQARIGESYWQHERSDGQGCHRKPTDGCDRVVLSSSTRPEQPACLLRSSAPPTDNPLEIVFSDAFSDEKALTMRAFGAKLTIVPSDNKKITEALSKAMIETARQPPRGILDGSAE